MEISEVTLSNVRSAYSGKHGCCCGCNGDHVYQERTRAFASKWRGYDVHDDEVNEKKLEAILKKIKKHPDSENEGDMITLRTERKLYIVYLLTAEETI